MFPSRRNASRTLAAILAVAAVLGVPAACCTWHNPDDPLEGVTQEAACSTRIAVLAVKRLADFRDDLQPNFSMNSGDQALAHVLPVTATVQDIVRQGLATSLKLGLPSSSTVVEDVLTQTTGQPDTSKTTTTTTTKSADLSAAEVPSAPTWTAPSLPAGQFANDRTGMDPMLRFLVATALYQEVKLLNTYVRDAAIGSEYEAFVVRLQIAVAPTRRDFPLDVLLTLSFFLSEEEAQRLEEQRKLVGLNALPPDATSLQRQLRVLELLDMSVSAPAVAQLAPASLGERPVKVIPLLVTDNLEAALASRSRDEIRSFGVALLGVLGNLGVGAGVNQTLEALQAALAIELNSLLMVSQLSENTLQVRIGAPRTGLNSVLQPRVDYAEEVRAPCHRLTSHED